MRRSPQPLAGPDLDSFNASVGEIGFLNYREADSGWRLRRLVNRRYTILGYSLSGSVHYTIAEQNYTVEPGTFALFPAGLPHSAKSDPADPWCFYSCGFELTLLTDAADRRFNQLERFIPSAEPDEARALFNDLHRHWLTRGHGSMLRCRGIILQLLANCVRSGAAARRSTPHARRIEKIVQQIQADPTAPISADELAAQADLSPSHFRQLFRTHTGHPVKQYHNWVRINRAKDLLLSGECNVNQTAERLGFRDIYYFSRLFKKMTGVNPSHFRDG